MRFPKITISIVALAAANLVPLAGVFLLGWNAAVIVLLYWTENLVIGFYNILRMALVRVERPVLHLTKFVAIPFFCIHFGGFCAVHGVFILAFFNLGGGLEFLSPSRAWPGPLVFVHLLVSVIGRLWQSHPRGMEWPVMGLFASHGISFVHNYLLRKEYISLSIKKLFGQPYKRIVILHLAIIAGGIPIMMLDSPIPLLLILVFGKIGLDIHLHTKSHKAEAGKEK
jgi:hypothetical protein